jgi:ABC-2 type transport system permease protein
MVILRSTLAICFLTMRRQFRSKKTILSLVAFALCCGLVFLIGKVETHVSYSDDLEARGFQQFATFVVLNLLSLFYLPAVTQMYGAGAIGDEREEKSLNYLLVRPAPRSMIYLAKFLATVPIALFFTLGGLAGMEWTARLAGWPGLEGHLDVFLIPILLGSLAYLSFFHLLGVAFRHSTLISVVYVFLIEVFVGQVPGVLKRISISFYTRSSVFDSARAQGLSLDPPEGLLFLPLSGETANLVLIGLVCVFLIVGARIFCRKEYRDNV